MKINIRELAATDVPVVANLIKSMWLEHVNQEPQLLNREYLERYDTVKYVSDCLDNPKQRIFVAVVDDVVVGAARVEILEFHDMHNFDRLAYFDDLVVHPDHRRQGIATRLMEARLGFANAQGIKVVQAKIYSFNQAAQGLAEKQGFRDIYRHYYKFLDK